jgi:hypothetical protein
MKKEVDFNGYKLVKDESTYYINGFPEFPNKNKKSKKTFRKLESVILKEEELVFPLKFNMTERVVHLSNGTEEYFSITGIENLIGRDKSLFLNTQTFFKIKISFIENITELKIIYYTIDNNKGLIDCNSFEMLLDIISIQYNVKQFTPRRVEFLTDVAKLRMREIRQIPIIPVQWLRFDENGNLEEFPNLQLIDN